MKEGVGKYVSRQSSPFALDWVVDDCFGAGRPLPVYSEGTYSVRSVPFHLNTRGSGAVGTLELIICQCLVVVGHFRSHVESMARTT